MELNSPRICLIGSMKQKPMMDKIERALAWKGCVTLSPVDMKFTEEEIKEFKLEKLMEFLRAVQYQKILLSDLVIAIPKKDGSFTDDTQKEVDFANKYGRVVMKISNPDEIDSEEIKLALSKSKKNTIADLSTILIEALNIMLILPDIPEGWKKTVTEIVKEVDAHLFPDYNVVRDSMTDILQDAK